MTGRPPAPVLVLAGAALWGTTGTAQALGPEASGPAEVGALRILVGAIGLVVVVGIRSTSTSAVTSVAREFRTVAVAAVAIALYQVTFFAGVASAGVTIGTLVGIGSVPVATGALSAAMGQVPSRGWALGTAVTLAGVPLLAVGGDATGSVPALGLVLAVAAGVSYSVYTIACKRLMELGHGSGAVMATTWAGGAVLLAPTLLGRDLGWSLSPTGLAMVAWLGLATVAVAYLLYGAGLARLPAASVASLTLAEPLTAALLGMLLLGEVLDARGLLGAVLVAAGLVVVSLPRRRVTPTPH